MPIINVRNIRKEASIGIWEITENEIELLTAYPANEQELLELNSYTHAFRRLQFLASRLLLHTLLPGAKIIYDANGKPHPNNEETKISISHSGNLIAIMTDSTLCGIDIEMIHPKIERIASKFLSDAELIECGEDSKIERLHIYWCIKEALYKVQGKKNVSLKSDIFVSKFSNSSSGSTIASIQLDGQKSSKMVNYEKYGDFILAWTEQ